MTHPLTIGNQHFVLHPSGAMFWEEEALLFISDVHLGKVSHFRKYGAAVPRGAILGNFELLDRTLEFFNPRGLYFLGDLFHSYLNSEWQFFETWSRKTVVSKVLIRGNHDIISPLKYEQLGIELIQEHLLQGFLFTHHPEPRQGVFNVSGHVHPAITLRGKGRQSLRLPCFFKNAQLLILPAFGAFTGSHTLQKRAGDDIFAIAGQQVIKI